MKELKIILATIVTVVPLVTGGWYLSNWLVLQTNKAIKADQSVIKISVNDFKGLSNQIALRSERLFETRN